MSQLNDENLANAVNTAKQIFSAEDCAKIERLLANQKATQALAASLSEKDMKAVSAVMNDPKLLKQVLRSPKASESLKRILEGFNGQ